MGVGILMVLWCNAPTKWEDCDLQYSPDQLHNQEMTIPGINCYKPNDILQVQNHKPRHWEQGQADLRDSQHPALIWLNKVV